MTCYPTIKPNNYVDDGRGDSPRFLIGLLPAAPVKRDVEAVEKPQN